MDTLKFTAEQILAIDTSQPEKLFSKEGFIKEFMRLRSKWHPDKNTTGHTDKVFDHLYQLSVVAEDKIAHDTWDGEATITFDTSTHKTFRFKYRKMRTFELGKMYIGHTVVMYVIDSQYDDLYDNGVKMIKAMQYPDSKFQKEFSKYFPVVKLQDKKTSIGMVLVIEKPKGAVLLQDLIEYLPENRIEPRHVAWITNRNYNIATFLDYIGICHNSIIPTTVFVDPAQHSVMLLGGWWYATHKGENLKALPSELLKVLPSKIFDEKKSQSQYDRLAIKGVAIGCLGDPTLVGMKLLANKDIPNPLLNWLRSPSGDNAVKEYEGWYHVLEKSFGKPKFIKFNINVEDIY